MPEVRPGGLPWGRLFTGYDEQSDVRLSVDRQWHWHIGSRFNQIFRTSCYSGHQQEAN